MIFLFPSPRALWCHRDHASRTDALSARVRFVGAGYRVLRFWNNQVLNEIDGVRSAIDAAMCEMADSAPPTPDPSPPRASRAGGGEPKR